MAKFNINDEIVFIEEAHKEHPKITRIVQVGKDEYIMDNRLPNVIEYVDKYFMLVSDVAWMWSIYDHHDKTWSITKTPKTSKEMFAEFSPYHDTKSWYRVTDYGFDIPQKAIRKIQTIRQSIEYKETLDIPLRYNNETITITGTEPMPNKKSDFIAWLAERVDRVDIVGDNIEISYNDIETDKHAGIITIKINAYKDMPILLKINGDIDKETVVDILEYYIVEEG